MALEETSFPFPELPLDLQHRLVASISQQLDQRHQFGVVPRVCRSWREASLATCHAITSTLETPAAAERLSLWLHKHGSSLGYLRLYCRAIRHVSQSIQVLLGAVAAARQLRTLRLDHLRIREQLHPLSALTSLTALHLRYCFIKYESLPALFLLTNLQTLDLYGNFFDWPLGHMAALSSSLKQLRSLDLSRTYPPNAELPTLCSLQHLQELRLEGCFVSSAHLGALHTLPCTAVGLYLEGEPEEVPRVAAWLRRSAPLLEWLDLVWDGVALEGGEQEDALAASIAPLLPAAKRLRSLALNHIRIGPHISNLTGLTQLTSLALRDCGVEVSGGCQLTSLTALVNLSLRENPGVAGSQVPTVEALVSCLPKLRSCLLDGFEVGFRRA